MVIEPEEKRTEGIPRKKDWLSGPWVHIGASALMGLLAGGILFLMGLAEFNSGQRDVGIAYLALTGAFPAAMVAVGWLTGRKKPLFPRRDGATGKRKAISRLRSLVDCGDMTPLILLLAATALGAGAMAFTEGARAWGTIMMLMGAALPPAAAIPIRWMTGGWH